MGDMKGRGLTREKGGLLIFEAAGWIAVLEREVVKQQLACRAPFQAEKLAPSAKLTTVHIPLRPSESVMAPLLGKRDALPNQRTIHSLLLTYKLTVVEAGKHTIRLPLLNKYVRMPWVPVFSGTSLHGNATEFWRPSIHTR